MFRGQLTHLLATACLLAGLYAASHLEGFLHGSFLGLSTPTWILLTVANAIVHQVYVWLCWRAELCHGWLRAKLGEGAFKLYAAGFIPLIVARPVLIVGLAVANAGTVPGEPLVFKIVAAILAIPAMATLVSVKLYFGFDRAMGIDHFDPSYRSLPFVRKGVFRYTSNAMYLLGFLLIWIPGLWLQSLAALAVALFAHLYIWVHYFCTERPDFEILYGTTG